jgi:hypothetical protein
MYLPMPSVEPVVDSTEFGPGRTTYSGFFEHFSLSGLPGGLSILDVPFGQTPFKTPTAVNPPNQDRAHP